jgi:endo-1,4-beta-D-glucanase Y
MPGCCSLQGWLFHTKIDNKTGGSLPLMTYFNIKLLTYKIYLLTAVVVQLYSDSIFSQASGPYMPFPTHSTYFPGVIKPNNQTQTQMDETVMRFYDHWKKSYVSKVPDHYIKQGDPGQFYVYAQDKNDTDQLTTSEQQGYGMIITSLMAGYDTSSQQTFNGLFTYVKAHPSNADKDLMAWQQNRDFVDLDSSSAAPDGDMDIAYSLLVADSQWGSKGEINYLHEAKKILRAVSNNEINVDSYTILLAPEDKDTSGTNHYFYERSSDFMPANFKIFANVLNKDSILWEKLINKNYKIFETIQNNYSQATGLIPDVIGNVNTDHPQPTKRRVLNEKTEQNAYSYNACRVPWRLATDYILNGDLRSERLLNLMNKWIISKTMSVPGHIAPGYELNGRYLGSHPDFDNFDAMPFLVPFAVSAMIDSGNQVWLNKLWDFMNTRDFEKFDSYDNTIKMYCIIIISGNYWLPKLKKEPD